MYTIEIYLPFFIYFHHFIIFINHRPLFGISKDQITDAFNVISKHCVQAFGRRSRGNPGDEGDHPQLLWNDLEELMKQGAEALSEEEFRSCLQSLVGEEGADISGHIGPLSFADNVLGFADYDTMVDGGEGEYEEEEYEQKEEFGRK